MTATLIVSMLCTYLMCFCVMFWLISRRLPGQRMGMNVFAVGHFLLSCAYILQLLGMATVLNHTLTLAAPLTYCIASMRFFDRKAKFWRPILIFSASYTAAQGLALYFGGTLAQYALLSASACLLFLGMSAFAAYGMHSFAKDFALEMLLFALLIGGFSVFNGLKLFNLLQGGMAALDMGTQFQAVFYIYMLTMTTVLPPTMIWLVLRRLTDELRAVALRDPLTQLLNRRGLTDGLNTYFRTRNLKPAHLLMIDIDHFKKINDNHGHKAGDMVLRHTAKVLKSITREGDLVCRLGGEEFVMVFFNLDDHSVSLLAERIRAAVENTQTLLKGSKQAISCTVTIGVSEGFTESDALDLSMQQADSALYRGKSAGRNRIEYAAHHHQWLNASGTFAQTTQTMASQPAQTAKAKPPETLSSTTSAH